MLLLLPPSEGKAAPARRGHPVDHARLSFPELAPARAELGERLVAVSSLPDAATRLGAGASLAEQVAANLRLWTTPARPASSVYTGILYDALGLPDLPAPASRRAARQVVIASALWGALRPGDRIPPYRLSIGSELPGLGPLAAWWRPRLAPAMAAAAGRSVIVDCRSSGYAAMWSPQGDQASRWVSVRVLREGAGGRTVVSHLAKLTRGELARHLLTSPSTPRTVPQLAQAAATAYDVVELTAPARPGRPWVLDVVLPEG